MPKVEKKKSWEMRSNRGNPYSTSSMKERYGGSRTGLRSQDSSHVKPSRVKPRTPAVLWNGKRPGFIISVESRVKNKAKSSNEYKCAKCKNLFKEADIQIDHIEDWRTFIYNNCDFKEHEIGGHRWRGYLKKDVLEAYNDEKNLQILCASCNAKKSGPKHFDFESAEYIGPV